MERARVRRNIVYAGRLALRATTRLFEATGARALDDGDPLQRCFRDVHSGVHHVQMAREGTMSNYGESALNLPYKFHFLRDNVDPALCLI